MNLAMVATQARIKILSDDALRKVDTDFHVVGYFRSSDVLVRFYTNKSYTKLVAYTLNRISGDSVWSQTSAQFYSSVGQYPIGYMSPIFDVLGLPSYCGTLSSTLQHWNEKTKNSVCFDGYNVSH